jgi:hypothetical protein
MAGMKSPFSSPAETRWGHTQSGTDLFGPRSHPIGYPYMGIPVILLIA